MIQTATQLKDLIRNLAKRNHADAQVLLRNYMMERFLERVSHSKYQDHFILKGGTLIASLVGLQSRSTMDIDASIKGATIGVDTIEQILSEILSVSVDDQVSFHTLRISQIMDNAEYPGVRVSLQCLFDGMRIPIKLDISTGDIITPRAIQYQYKLMLEDRSIDIWAYNLETLLAEKVETILSRSVTNTRMRDFYDIYILTQLYGSSIHHQTLQDALLATMHQRHSTQYLKDANQIFKAISCDSTMQQLWKSYQKSYSYASNLPWNIVLDAVIQTYHQAIRPDQHPSFHSLLEAATQKSRQNSQPKAPKPTMQSRDY